jgi:hypothetical protein
MMGLVVFGGNLYYADSRSNGAVTVIRKFNGTSWSTVTSSPTTVLTISWVTNGVLFFGGGGNFLAAQLWSSPDGTTWTDRSANLSNNTGLTLAGSGVATVMVYP